MFFFAPHRLIKMVLYFVSEQEKIIRTITCETDDQHACFGVERGGLNISLWRFPVFTTTFGADPPPSVPREIAAFLPH